MPMYSYRCTQCGHEFEAMAKLAEYDQPKDCEECEAPAERYISGMPGLIFPGDGWTTKNLRIKRQMQEKNKRLDKKMQERRNDAPGMQLAPNVGGERVDSWSEASRLAASKGKDVASYEPMVRREKTKGTE